MKHGSSGYTKHKCRCDVCKAGQAAYRKRYNESKPQAYPRHRNVAQWPVGPLLELVPDLRVRLDLDTHQWERATVYGLSDRTADHWATKLGYHPGVVWADWFDRGLQPLDDVFVNGTEGAEPGWRLAALYGEGAA